MNAASLYPRVLARALGGQAFGNRVPGPRPRPQPKGPLPVHSG
jgi:hypothetical protein